MNASARKSFAVWIKYYRSSDPVAEIAKTRKIYWLSVLLLGVVAGAIAALFPEDAQFAIGVAAGAAIASVVSVEQRLRAFQKIWPELREVVDWERVESRLKEEPNRVAGGN